MRYLRFLGVSFLQPTLELDDFCAEVRVLPVDQLDELFEELGNAARAEPETLGDVFLMVCRVVRRRVSWLVDQVVTVACGFAGPFWRKQKLHQLQKALATP